MGLAGRKVLITGGAGFVGSILARCLTQRYRAHVTILDDLSTGSRQHISGLEATLIEGTVEDKDLVDSCINDNEVVFHLAARGIVASSVHPEEDYRVNIGGTLNLLNASLKHGVKKFIYTSTSSVYGNSRYIPINEDDDKNFLNLYSVSKFAAESYCKVFYELYEFPATILRLSNVYGENQSPQNPYCGVIGKFASAALKGETLEIHGDGDQTRDFTYIDDAVEALVQAALSSRATGQVYNVGTGTETTINDLATRIVSLCNSDSQLKHVDRRDVDNIRRRVLNIERIRHDLRWTPQISLDEGLKRTIEWVKRAP